MACCAFAAFLLVQMLAPFRAFRAWFVRARGKGPSLPGNAAVAWRAGAPAQTKVARTWSNRTRGVFAAAIAVELAIAAAWGVHVNSQAAEAGAPQHAAATVAGDWDALVALHTYWCGTADSARQ